MNLNLNLVFHKIVLTDSEINSPYTITLNHFITLKHTLIEIFYHKNPRFNKINFYFDDNYSSFQKYISPIFNDEPINYILATPTAFIDKDGYMSKNTLSSLNKTKIKIVPHGVSHSALCIYKNNHLLDTESGGLYINQPYGKNRSLTEKEVEYQLIESKKQLELIGIKDIEEFVLPYGLYNEQTIKINKKQSKYKYISTCDEFLDSGELLKPRLLITNTKSILELNNQIKQLNSRIS